MKVLMNISLNFLSGRLLTSMSLGFLLWDFIFILLFGTFSFVSLWWDGWSWVDMAQEESQVESNNGTHRYVQTLKRPSAVPLFGRSTRVSKQLPPLARMVQAPLNCWCFAVSQGGWVYTWAPLQYPSLVQSTALWVDSHRYCGLLSFLSVSLWSFYLQ